jgi:hypothetical protein
MAEQKGSGLSLIKPDGSAMTRLEAEHTIRTSLGTVHHMRHLASRDFGLDKKLMFLIKPVSVIHWILDEMVRRKLIIGEEIGVKPELESDPNYFNTFQQKIAAFVQSNQAMMPKEGEGVNMSDINNMMPPGAPPQNGHPQTGFAPPPPPPPMFQSGAPTPNVPPPPPQTGFGAAPPTQQSFGPPTGMPQQFGPPNQTQQTQPAFPPAPGGQPSHVPPPPPPVPAQTRTPRATRKSNDLDKTVVAAPPASSGFGQQFGAPGANMPMSSPLPASVNQVPVNMTPTMPTPMGAPAQDPRIDQLQQQIASLSKIVEQQSTMLSQILQLSKNVDMACSIVTRVYYQQNLPTRPEQLGCEVTFKDIGLPIPQ